MRPVKDKLALGPVNNPFGASMRFEALERQDEEKLRERIAICAREASAGSHRCADLWFATD
jgi:hypothetical protein